MTATRRSRILAQRKEQEQQASIASALEHLVKAQRMLEEQHAAFPLPGLAAYVAAQEARERGEARDL